MEADSLFWFHPPLVDLYLGFGRYYSVACSEISSFRLHAKHPAIWVNMRSCISRDVQINPALTRIMVTTAVKLSSILGRHHYITPTGTLTTAQTDMSCNTFLCLHSERRYPHILRSDMRSRQNWRSLDQWLQDSIRLALALYCNNTTRDHFNTRIY